MTFTAETLGDGRESTVLDRPTRCDAVPDLVPIVASMMADESAWRPKVRHLLDHRHYERLVLTEVYEVWLICWDLGQMTLLHDHGGARGAFGVVQGALLEDYAPPGASRLRQRRIGRGSVRAFGATYVHNLANSGPGLATSIHAYAGPLSTMTYYAVLPDGLAPVRTRPVEAPEPARP